MQGIDHIRSLAELSVRRACGFAVLGIWTVVVGLISMPLMAVKAGAILLTILGTVLLHKALTARHRAYRRTELWILLDGKHGLPEDSAQRVLGNVLRDVYWRYAEFSAWAALALWLLALVLAVMG